MKPQETHKITFNHLVDLPNCGCVFCSTKDEVSGLTRLYLIFNEKNRLYVRNGVRQRWEEIKDQHERDFVLSHFNRVIFERQIPCFASAASDTEVADINNLVAV